MYTDKEMEREEENETRNPLCKILLIIIEKQLCSYRGQKKNKREEEGRRGKQQNKEQCNRRRRRRQSQTFLKGLFFLSLVSNHAVQTREHCLLHSCGQNDEISEGRVMKSDKESEKEAMGEG